VRGKWHDLQSDPFVKLQDGTQSNGHEGNLQNVLDGKSINMEPRYLSLTVQHKSRPPDVPSVDPKFRLRLTRINGVFCG
jgi:hypothetical protein